MKKPDAVTALPSVREQQLTLFGDFESLRSERKRRNVTVLYTDVQLELPIFGYVEKPHSGVVLPFLPKVEWTEDDVDRLREGMLKYYLKLLEDVRYSEATKAEIMDWIECTERTPFSFEICALAASCDPDELRANLKSYLSRLQK